MEVDAEDSRSQHEVAIQPGVECFRFSNRFKKPTRLDMPHNAGVVVNRQTMHQSGQQRRPRPRLRHRAPRPARLTAQLPRGSAHALSFLESLQGARLLACLCRAPGFACTPALGIRRILDGNWLKVTQAALTFLWSRSNSLINAADCVDRPDTLVVFAYYTRIDMFCPRLSIES